MDRHRTSLTDGIPDGSVAVLRQHQTLQLYNGLMCKSARSGRRTERLEFRIGGRPFGEVMRAVTRREPKQTRRVVLRALPQRQFAAVEVRLADLALLLRGVWIIGGG